MFNNNVTRLLPAYGILFFIAIVHFCFTKVCAASLDQYYSSITGCSVPTVWQPLVDRLIDDGEDRSYITALFSSKAVSFKAGVMPRKIVHDESKLRYDLFLKPERVKRARKFYDSNFDLLHKVEQQYGVAKEIMVSILLVETDLGNYLGPGPAFDILASMAAATDIEHVKGLLPPDRLKGLNHAKVETKLRKKSAWAYGELRSLIKYANQNRMDLLSIKGSIFGAVGLCQFMPSNIAKFGVDFDRDGAIDMFQKQDALASMANYLKHYGWKEKLSLQKQERVVMHYNHSRPYAQTILKVAEELK